MEDSPSNNIVNMDQDQKPIEIKETLTASLSIRK